MPSLKSLVEVFYFWSDARPIFFVGRDPHKAQGNDRKSW